MATQTMPATTTREVAASELVEPLDPQFIYGMVAEFEEPSDITEAAHQAHLAGYSKMDAYTPFPVEGLAKALGIRDVKMPTTMLIGGIIGCCTGFCLTNYGTMIYPMNIAGKPLFSWPMFIPITFECTVLFAALSGIFGMLYINGLPMPYHPVFDAPHFERATSDRFFLCIEAHDPKFDLVETRRFLESLNPDLVSVIELRK
jgi:Protein of unknown function (DUF3341)